MRIYYFSRTGRSKKIAQELAKHYSVDLCEIKDEENWQGKINFLKGGAMAAGKKAVKAIYKENSDNKKIVLVFPVWASTFPPAVRTFIGENKRDNIILIPTSLGTKLSDREGFVKIIDLVGKNIETPKSL